MTPRSESPGRQGLEQLGGLGLQRGSERGPHAPGLRPPRAPFALLPPPAASCAALRDPGRLPGSGAALRDPGMFCPAPAPKLPRKPHDPSERAEREMLSPWDLQVPGSFPDLVTQFPREREGRVYSCQRRSPNGGESLRLRPTDLSPTAGQGRRDTPGSAEGNTEGPGTASSEPLLPS